MLRCRLQFALPMSFKRRVKSITTIANLVLSLMVPRDYLHPYTIVPYTIHPYTNFSCLLSNAKNSCKQNKTVRI